ncbi:MAG: hypothetical protein ACTSYR_04020 [Candidatus Odinarchaeia archaeon]
MPVRNLGVIPGLVYDPVTGKEIVKPRNGILPTEAKERFQERSWTSQDSSEISMFRMSNKHILNAIKYIEKCKIQKLILQEKKLTCCFGMGEEWLPVLRKEAEARDILRFY